MDQGIRTSEPTANTSHSLPSTSLATPSTTNLSITTSVNPPFTGTCSTVSIEVQNVTEEEIQLSWTSSSKGSLYNISVMDGEEINTTTTKDTETVFKNLLPGHVYNISVAVSSCVNNRSSVTVRTDPTSGFEITEFCSAQSTHYSDLKSIACSSQAFACSVRLKNEIFNNTLYNSASEDYKTMSERIKTDVVEGMHAELPQWNDTFNIVMLDFRPGSVVANFLFLLPKEATDVGNIQTHLKKVLRNKFGLFQTEVQPLSVQSSTDNSSSWRVAVIVLGVLLGVALVLILLAILFYIYVRRRSGKYLVEPSGLIGMFVYKHL
ncbi:PREDICTED: uncharacterized protein LOC106628354 isoform X1 [Pseudopodoces humilis]|uniref:uncharacterized protein LOC106628354 isoform X1 n=1 Tax=Pseudopodoces humilis TaxID=181119 RepID=UPI0006B7038E|nr:PREDICTED: uncharacterized protein LOC106628354 isoform X1 [Pseudopodoces humilis]